jgi:hypothetical protein
MTTPQQLQRGQAIALTLSGGGTRLYAHLGVIEACEALGLKPTQILGVSGGAIVAALWACLGSAGARRVLLELPVVKLKRFAWGRNFGIWDNAAIREIGNAEGLTWAAAAARGVDLRVGVTALEPGVPLIWDGRTSPVELAEAARISGSIPFLWGTTPMEASKIQWPAMPKDAVLPEVVTLTDGGCTALMLPASDLPLVASNIAFNGYRDYPIGGYMDLLAQILGVSQYRTMQAAIDEAEAVISHRRCRAVGWLDSFSRAEIIQLVDDAREEALAILRPLVAE